MDVSQLFALADRSRLIADGRWDCGDDDQDVAMDPIDGDDGDDGDDEYEHVVLVQLSGGGFHACRGRDCPHAVQSAENDRSWICNLSGRFISTPCESAHDASWTGRSCTSADPDMQSGNASGGWRAKRSAFSASAAAYSKASDEKIDDVKFYNPKGEQTNNAPPKEPKRGAPCIVDIDETMVAAQKRNKALRRIHSLRDKSVQSRLLADASSVVIRLYSTMATTSKPPTAVSATAAKRGRAVAGAASTIQDDPRLENYDFVLNMALKRYAARLKQANELPTISGIHDVCIAANQFVKQRKRDAAERCAPSDAKSAKMLRAIALSGKTIELCAQLIFALWRAMCTTPYFLEQQSSDSFRPFSAGVMYAFKRGLRLPNNIVLVPSIDALSSQLPTLRSSTATPAAKQLQQASHRGLCAIQRGLSSIDKLPEDEQRVALDQLKIVAGIAKRLNAFVLEQQQQRMAATVTS